MKSTQLKFVKRKPANEFKHADLAALPMFVLNRSEWRGKPPRSCAITNCKSHGDYADPSKWMTEITVSHRPRGYISYVGHTRYDGWTAMPLDRSPEGTLLDGNGNLLAEGQPPVYRPTETYRDIDFNELDLGEFVDEIEAEEIERTTVEEVRAEINKDLSTGGRVSSSCRGKFIAPHRDRPERKIMLSNAPTCLVPGGFGDQFLNIDLSTPHVEHVVMEALVQLMCDFIEGKISIQNQESESLTFVQLSTSLIDCSPNEQGIGTWFDVLSWYTPVTFLEDLAKRLTSIYAVETSIVEGKHGGLVLRPDLTQ